MTAQHRGEETQELPQPSLEGPKRRPLRSLAAMVVIAVLLALVAFLVVEAQNYAVDSRVGSLEETNRQNALAAQKRDQAIQALTNDSNAYRKALQQRGVDPNKVAPPPQSRTSALPGIPGAPGAAGANASDAQVRSAVEAYFALHPVRNGETPSATDIAIAVANYLQQNPPAPGPAGSPGANATGDQVAAAVAGYMRDHASDFKGAKGEPGADATDSQVAAAVKAYIDAHPLPLCPDGYSAVKATVQKVDDVGLPAGSVEILTCSPSSTGGTGGFVLLLPWMLILESRPRRLLLPLLTQATRFLRRAHRAVALAAVRPVQKVAVFAMRLLGVDRSRASAVLQRILASSDQPQVGDVDAMPYSAKMVDHHSWRDLAVGIEPRDPVGCASISADADVPVPVLVKRSCPEDAPTRGRFAARAKARAFSVSQSTSHGAPSARSDANVVHGTVGDKGSPETKGT
jgi:hypothetical protein